MRKFIENVVKSELLNRFNEECKEYKNEDTIISSRWEIGKFYCFRTVTMINVGVLVDYDHHEFWITNAAWIPDTCRYHEFLKGASPDEMEPYPDGAVIPVGRGALIDGCEIKNPQKITVI